MGPAVLIALSLAGLGCSEPSAADSTPGRQSRALESADAGSGTPNHVNFGPAFEQNPRVYVPTAIGDVAVRGIAYDGQNYLVIWQYWGNRQWAQAARVSPQGQLLDIIPIDIHDQGRRETVMAVASDGSGFVVGYASLDPSGATPKQYRLKRITSDGVLQDPLGIELTVPTHNIDNLHLAASGGNMLAVWTEQTTFSYSDPFTLRGALIDDSAAQPVQQAFDIGQTLPSTVTSSVEIAVAAGHDGYLLAYTTRADVDAQSGFDLALTRISRSGELVAPVPGEETVLQLQATSNHQLALACDGDDYYLVWTDFAKNTQGQWLEAVFGVAVSRAGHFSATQATQLTTSDQNYGGPQVVFNSGQYWIAFIVGDVGVTPTVHELHALSVSQLGVPSAEPATRVAQGNMTEAVFPPTCGPGCTFAWSSDAAHTATSIFSAPFEPTGWPIAQNQATSVSVQPEVEGLSQLTCSATGCMALYTSEVHDFSGIHLYLKAAGLDLSGHLQPNAIWTIAELGDQMTVETALASNGKGYLAVWWDSSPRQLYSMSLAERLGPTSPVQTILTEATPVHFHLHLASLGQDYVLTRTVEQGNKHQLSGMRLSRAGSLIAPSTFRMDSDYYGSIYASHLIAASDQYFLGYMQDGNARVARLNNSGELIQGSAVKNLTTVGEQVLINDMVSNGRQLLVSWCDPKGRDPKTGLCVPRATIVERNSESRNLTAPMGPASLTGALAWSGNAYVWAWSEQPEWEFGAYPRHVTELTVNATGEIASRDSVTLRELATSGPSQFTMTAEGLLWSYPVSLGNPSEQFVGPSRVHRRQITGLCFGDPLGDGNGNGICDSAELPLIAPDAGVTSSGGQSSASGGSPSSGGAFAAIGGSATVVSGFAGNPSSLGGSLSSGGVLNSGGSTNLSSLGGAASSGGTLSSGGSTSLSSLGGAASSGGTLSSGGSPLATGGTRTSGTAPADTGSAAGNTSESNPDAGVAGETHLRTGTSRSESREIAGGGCDCRLAPTSPSRRFAAILATWLLVTARARRRQSRSAHAIS